MKRHEINEFGENVVMMEAEDRGPLTDEEWRMINRLDDFVDDYDEDCPPIPEAMVYQMEADIAAMSRRGVVMPALVSGL